MIRESLTTLQFSSEGQISRETKPKGSRHCCSMSFSLENLDLSSTWTSLGMNKNTDGVSYVVQMVECLSDGSMREVLSSSSRTI